MAQENPGGTAYTPRDHGAAGEKEETQHSQQENGRSKEIFVTPHYSRGARRAEIQNTIDYVDQNRVFAPLRSGNGKNGPGWTPQKVSPRARQNETATLISKLISENAAVSGAAIEPSSGAKTSLGLYPRQSNKVAGGDPQHSRSKSFAADDTEKRAGRSKQEICGHLKVLGVLNREEQLQRETISNYLGLYANI